MLLHLRTYFTHKHSLAIGAVFVSMGFLYGNWATLIPFIKQKFDLNDAELGLLLLCMPFGSTVTNPLATVLIQSFGMRWTTIFGVFFLAFAFALPFLIDNLAITAVVLVLVGSSEAITNIAMNTCVTNIENHEGINIMSTCHGMFSAGLMLGSVMASLLIGMHISPQIQCLLISSLIVLLALFIRPTINQIHEEKTTNEHRGGGSPPEGLPSEAKFVLPKGAFLLMICISLCTNVTEGSMADWTAVYMRDIVQTNAYAVGWGLAGYSMFMALGRFLGDNLIPKYGTNNMLKFGGIIAALGILLAVLLPNTATAIVGFAFVGAGVSCAAPILYGSAARIPNMAKGAGLATMNTFSIGGFLAGPVVIGFISKATSLPIAISVIAVLALLWSFLSGKVKLY
jgi:MFS family permease